MNSSAFRDSQGRTPQRPIAEQSGMMLIESLVAMAIFAIGILGLVGLQARMNSAVVESKYRAEAALLVDELIGAMWSDAHGGPWNPSSTVVYANNIPDYAHYASGGTCAASFTGAASANPNVVRWLGNASQKGSVLNLLPNAEASRVQIQVNANIVTVTLCWRTPSDPDTSWHSYQTTAVVRG